MIRAEAHSDDYKATAKFEATPRFAQAFEPPHLVRVQIELGQCGSAMLP
jgi:hypothetical protein